MTVIITSLLWSSWPNQVSLMDLTKYWITNSRWNPACIYPYMFAWLSLGPTYSLMYGHDLSLTQGHNQKLVHFRSYEWSTCVSIQNSLHGSIIIPGKLVLVQIWLNSQLSSCLVMANCRNSILCFRQSPATKYQFVNSIKSIPHSIPRGIFAVIEMEMLRGLTLILMPKLGLVHRSSDLSTQG